MDTTRDKTFMFNRGSLDSVEIDESNTETVLSLPNQLLLSNDILWHRFTVYHASGLNREEVLKPIIDFVSPCDLIPGFFCQQPTGTVSCFLARNCENAIKKLCKAQLVVHCANLQIFKLSITLNFSNTNKQVLDIQKNVLAVLHKRMNQQKKCLNLNNFAQDQELTEYCPLSQHKVMYFVLHLAKPLQAQGLILSNNNIKVLNPLKVLSGWKIKYLDISNNDISSVEDLAVLKYVSPKKVMLTGNPVCENEKANYMQALFEFCPSLEILNGVACSRRLPATRKNFLCNDLTYDLANQFLEHFFTMYDSKDRSLLAEMYHPDAIFSMTNRNIYNQKSTDTAYSSLRPFTMMSTKNKDNVAMTVRHFKGPLDIIDMYVNHLPKTTHDPYSFTTDVMIRTTNSALIVVTGVFKQIPEHMLGFMRTFLLQINHESKWIITNEQYHVYNALTSQEATHFKLPVTHTGPIVHAKLNLEPTCAKHRSDLVQTLVEITNLQDTWARKCLEECNFDLKKSIEFFVSFYEGDKFPSEAFRSCVTNNYYENK